jgi:hypothetical protein
MMLPRKLEGLARELREDSPASEKLFRVAQKGLRSLGLHPAFSIERCVIVELRQPPKATRGLSDLLIRRATERDIPALVKLDNRDAGLLKTRLDRGDLLYLGQLGEDVVCCTCFYRGPAPFDDERSSIARWALGAASTFWSYDAMAPLEMRSAGVVAKLFQVALRELFEAHGCRLVRGFIHDWNQPSLMLHQRLGFTTTGRATAVAVPGLKWLRWETSGRGRQWLLPRNSDFALPPAET